MPNTVHELILSYMIRNSNDKQLGYPLLREAADDCWYVLFKKTPESIVRKWVEVGKGGIAKYPECAERVLGLYTIDRCNDLAPLYEDNKKSDFPEPAATCSCNANDHCECLCPTITESEMVVVPVMIEGTEYLNKYFTRVLKDGSIIEEKHEWVASYNKNGVYAGAVEVPSQNVVSKLELSPCGCLAKTEDNTQKLLHCGCYDNSCLPALRVSYPALYNEFGYYKLNAVTRTISVFGPDGKPSKLKWIEVKYQSNGADMLVPEYAKQTFIAMLDWYKKLYNPLYDANDRKEALKNFNRQKSGMLKYIYPIPYELVSSRLPVFQRKNHSSFTQEMPPQYSLNTGCSSVPTIVRQTIVVNGASANYIQVIANVDGASGSPVAGSLTWQSDSFTGAEKIPMFFVNKNPENEGSDYTIDYTTGILTRNNPWVGTDGEDFPGDELIVPLFKKQ